MQRPSDRRNGHVPAGWMVVGFVAGFLASHLALGHGLGLAGDLIAGIVGALIVLLALRQFRR